MKRHKLSMHALEAILVLVVLALIGAGIAVGWYVGWRSHEAVSTQTVTVTEPAATGAPTETTPAAQVTPAVAAGAHAFIQFGCFACHGEMGAGGVSPDVPALTGAGKTFTVEQLTSIINHGLGEAASATAAYMPVWTGVISPQQISDLVAYLEAGLPAVPGAVPPDVPRDQGDVVAGAALYEYYGCINCHGPNGLGGVPNPQSPDQTIPPLAGSDFRQEFDTDQKIMEIIASGSVLGKQPIVSMPHWGGIITDPDMQALLAYLKVLAP